jgi:MFS family permease
MIQAILLAGLTWKGWITPGLLVFLAFLMGCINAMDMPARQSLVVHLVDHREDLSNAIALNSFLMNATRFVGPALAGFVVTLAGEAACFILNGLSYLAVLLALRAIRARTPGRGSAPALRAILQGLGYAYGHPGIRVILILVASVSFLVTPYVVMMPLYAKAIFGGDARTFGLLMSSAGAGALLASLYLASRTSTRGLTRKVFLAATVSGAALALFAVNSHLGLAFPILMVLGFSVIVTVAGSNTLIQTWVQDDMRGRVMATFSMAFLGIAPLGSLAVGSIAHIAGVRQTLLACGLLTLLVGLARGHRPGRKTTLKNA